MISGMSKPNQTRAEEQQIPTSFIAVMTMLVGYAIGLKMEAKILYGISKITINLQNFIKKKTVSAVKFYCKAQTASLKMLSIKY